MNTGQLGVQVSATGESLNVSTHACICYHGKCHMTTIIAVY